jgi:hypothetical protein
MYLESPKPLHYDDTCTIEKYVVAKICSIYTFFCNVNTSRKYDWLIDYARFYVPPKKLPLIWRRHHCRWRAAKFRPMLGTQGLWAGRDLYRATPVTRDLGFSGLIRRTAPFSCLLRHTGCVEDLYSNPNPHGEDYMRLVLVYFYTQCSIM